MTIADKMKDEIPQYVINRETGKKIRTIIWSNW